MIALFVMQLIQNLPAAAEPGADIVVTAKRLSDAHARCLAHRCTTAEDAQATIALAEQRLREGRYVEAKDMLSKAVARNRQFEKTFPRALATLYEAYGTVAFHEGDVDVFQQATSSRVGVLRRNLPIDDEAVVYAPITVGDMWTKLHRYRSAEHTYAAAERDAAAHGHWVAARVAALRRVTLLVASNRLNEANTVLARIERQPGGDDPTIRKGVQIARARVAAKQNESVDAERFVASVPPTRHGDPVLVLASPLPMSDAGQAKFNQRKFAASTPGDDIPAGIEWTDIGFRVMPDGHTTDITVLRGTVPATRTKLIIEQIAGRRYAAAAVGTDVSNAYRMERYTYRGDYRVPINSRIRRRWGLADMTMIDLSETPDSSADNHGTQ